MWSRDLVCVGKFLSCAIFVGGLLCDVCLRLWFWFG